MTSEDRKLLLKGDVVSANSSGKGGTVAAKDGAPEGKEEPAMI